MCYQSILMMIEGGSLSLLYLFLSINIFPSQTPPSLTLPPPSFPPSPSLSSPPSVQCAMANLVHQLTEVKSRLTSQSEQSSELQLERDNCVQVMSACLCDCYSHLHFKLVVLNIAIHSVK